MDDDKTPRSARVCVSVWERGKTNKERGKKVALILFINHFPPNYTPCSNVTPRLNKICSFQLFPNVSEWRLEHRYPLQSLPRWSDFFWSNSNLWLNIIFRFFCKTTKTCFFDEWKNVQEIFWHWNPAFGCCKLKLLWSSVGKLVSYSKEMQKIAYENNADFSIKTEEWSYYFPSLITRLFFTCIPQ